jgi:GNAT superfamily N-acetyltransferase
MPLRGAIYNLQVGIYKAAQFRLVQATENDAGLILQLIKDLAAYEKLSDQVSATEQDLRASLVGPRAAVEALIGYAGEEPAGFALYFQSFSTFNGRPGLYLEDLFVKPKWRRRGLGRMLLARLARIAVDRGYGRMEWSVLDWNEMALRVYRGVGAIPMDEWTVYRLKDDALRQLAAEDAPGARQPSAP